MGKSNDTHTFSLKKETATTKTWTVTWGAGQFPSIGRQRQNKGYALRFAQAAKNSALEILL